MALVERSRFANDRGKLARVRLVRLGRRQVERLTGRLVRMNLGARDCSVPSLGRQIIRRARLRGVDMPRTGWRQGRTWRTVAARVPLARKTDWLLGAFCPHSCSDCAHRKRLIVRGALAGGDRGVVVLMKLVGLVLRGLRAGTRNVSAGARALEGMRAASAGGDVSAWCVRCR